MVPYLFGDTSTSTDIITEDNAFRDSSNNTTDITMEDNALGGIAAAMWNPTSSAMSASYYKAPKEDAICFKHGIIGKITSVLSVLGSVYIIYSMVFNVTSASQRQKNLYQTYNRLLLCLCVADLISSTSYFMGSW